MRVLLVTSRFPLPPWRGNQFRTMEWLQALSRHEVAVVAPLPGGAGNDTATAELARCGARSFLYHAGPAARAAAALCGVLVGEPLQEALYHVGPGARALRQAVAAGPWDVAVVQMVRCGWAADLLASEAPQLPQLFDAIDAMGLHFERAAACGSALLRPARRWEARRAGRRERWLAATARVVTAVSDRDLEALGAPSGRGRVVSVSAPEGAERKIPPGRPTVLLSGNLGYRPTVDAARFLAREVWPEVRRRVPGACWVLAGARPVRAVRSLAREPGVEVHADVPDLAPFLAAASVAVAPMASGSGVPMKVLEAWAAGVPVVAHPWTAVGLAAEVRGAVAVAAGAEEWARLLSELLSRPERAAELATAGRRAWRQCYHPDRVHEQILAAVTAASLCSPPTSP